MITHEEMLLEGGNAITGSNPVTLTPNGSNRHHATTAIHNMLWELSKLHEKINGKLFGSQGLTSAEHSVYAGSTRQLMDHDPSGPIPSHELAKYKSTFGDIDTSIHPEHKNSLHELLENLSRPDHTGQQVKLGDYTVESVKKTGSEIHAGMRHANGSLHQVDFNTIPDDGWTKDKKGNRVGLNDTGRFNTSQHFDDLKEGIKGAAHKICLNAVDEDHKFAPNGANGGGLARRDGQKIGSKDIVRNPKTMFKTLFPNASSNEQDHIHSALGVARLVGRYKDPSTHQRFLDKTKERLMTIPGFYDRKSKQELPPLTHHMNKISEALHEGARSKHGKLGESEINSFKSWKLISEATLTSRGKEKVKEIADALKRDNPDWSDEKKFKIATSTVIKMGGEFIA